MSSSQEVESSSFQVTMTVSEDSIELFEGEAKTITATIEPSTVNQNVIWTSNNPEIAEVSDSGVITAVKEGSTTVVVTAEDYPDLIKTIAVTVKEVPFDPTPYQTVLSEAKADGKKRIEEHITDFEPYSEKGIAEIDALIQEGKDKIDLCNYTNEIIDLVYLYFGKLDAVYNAKEEKAFEFINLFKGLPTTSGYSSLELVSMNEEGKIIFNSLTAWGGITLGDIDGSPYKAFEADLYVDYETTRWGSFDLYINKQSDINSYDIHFTHNKATLYKYDNSTEKTEVDICDNTLKDDATVKFVILTDGTRKMVLINGTPILEIKENKLTQGYLEFSLWQAKLVFDNYKYKEYKTSEELNADYESDLAKSYFSNRKGKAEQFLETWLDKGYTPSNALKVTDSGEIVQDSTSWVRQRFSSKSSNNFEVFETDLIPNFKTSAGYVTFDFRCADDNHKFKLTLKEGTAKLTQCIWDTTLNKGVENTVVEEKAINVITSGQKVHIKILCSGWVKTIAIAGKLFSYNSESTLTCGQWGIDSNNATYTLINAGIRRYTSQNELSAGEGDLWSSSYSEKW